ncbi:MAG: phospholipid/cholesterol/gamma-HCH transport system substrate-binding protein [Acidimicrobiaceae bacterium]|jgi:phospholipid/cholesterol/gamma-HCH transport system substrate-binding protein
MSRRTLVNLVFFMLVFFVMCLWAVQNIVVIDRIDKPYTVTGEFAAASGILPNAEVAYLGVHYGRVTAVERKTGADSCGKLDGQPVSGCVKMTMKLDRDKKDIPKDAVARIFRKSAIGEPYIDFNPPADFDTQHAQPSDFLRNGDNVPIDHTQNPLEFSELLRSLGNLLSHVDAQKAGSLIHELALALDGRGDSLHKLTIAADELSATFAAKTDVLDRLATNNTRLTHVLGDHASDFGQALTNLSLLADSLKNANGDTAVLLDEGSQLMGQLADLVDSQKSNVDCILHDLADVIDATSTPARVQGTSDLLRDGKGAFDLVVNALDHEADGPWARVNLLADPTNAAPQYVPPHQLPPILAVPACTSTVPAGSGPDFVPSQLAAATTRTTTSLQLPATGGVTLIGLGAALLLAAAALRWVRGAADNRG